MLFKPSDQIVIKPRRSTWVPVFWSLAGLAAVTGLVFAAFHKGREEVRFDEAAMIQRLKLAVAEKGQVEAENSGLKDSLAVVTRQLQVDQAAYENLSELMTRSATEIAALKEELDFYRSILTPATDGPAVDVKRFGIDATGQPGEFVFRLTVIQSLDHDAVFEGRIEMEVVGMHRGEPRTLGLDEIAAESMPLNFRYFQNIEGGFELPVDFHPLRVRIKVSRPDEDEPLAERWYPWPLA